ncbi:hypothetical protein [Wolbachia endosymbiont of Phyllotreta cruciferae]|uniref:hypothetical protein n=1 Tax=Wolbachia endosymbiont of Phyllotreta cruciferae TaxID=2886377 RepID=UPI00209CD912|nr:hypothetical protein [Wolbachia endosymbiont of Phyllotreta cruciferae]
MEKYTNAWFNKKDNHDCANDGTCGQSIKDFRIGNSDISFFDSNKNLIAKVPKLPKYSRDKYGHQLYKEAESKQFNYFSTNIHDVLSNSFTVKYGYINCTIKYDNLSEQEQNQIETDIKTAYEAFKEKFCLKNSNASYNITVHIFNNRSDYTKYNNLLCLDEDGGPGYITRGVTDCQNILTYKQSAMDFVLGHELGHIFQLCFSPSATVQTLSILDTELIANVVGREVEEKNYKAICKQMGVDEYEDRGWIFSFKYKGTTYNVRCKDFSEEEKFQFIKDIKNSHESLVSECDGLGNDNTTLVIYIDENKEISRMYFQNSDKNIFKQLDKTFISRSKPEQDVEKSNEVEQSNVEEEKSSQQDTQQPSNFLSNIFSAIKSIIDSISSLFSWLFGSKEKESNQQSDDNPSLFKLDANELDHEVKPDANELGHDVRDHLSDNYNHYNSSDGLM